MAEKKLLLLETNFDVAEKYQDFLKDSVWSIAHKDSLNNFLASMKEDNFDVAIIEGGIVPDKIISMVITSKPVIICSDKKPDIDKITMISRDFSGSELVNALGKVSFMKVAGGASKEEQDYLIEETISQDKPVVLEPVVEEGEEVELLTPEDSGESVRSSWEIEKEDVDVEAETLVDDTGPEQAIESEMNTGENKEEKQDIFEKIDEIDSIIMSLNKDVDEKKEEVSAPDEKSEVKAAEKSVKGEEAADFLFDDDYKYEENDDGDKIGKISDEENVNSSRAADFESILSAEPEEKEEEKPLELNKEDEVETETVKEYQDSFDGMTDPENMEEIPAEEAVELTPEKVEENPEEEAVELTPEPVAEPEPVIEPEPEPIAESEPVEVADKIEEIESKVPEAEADVLKMEFRKWLDENARTIVKEVVEEQLKELYGKK